MAVNGIAMGSILFVDSVYSSHIHDNHTSSSLLVIISAIIYILHLRIRRYLQLLPISQVDYYEHFFHSCHDVLICCCGYNVKLELQPGGLTKMDRIG